MSCLSLLHRINDAHDAHTEAVLHYFAAVGGCRACVHACMCVCVNMCVCPDDACMSCVCVGWQKLRHIHTQHELRQRECSEAQRLREADFTSLDVDIVASVEAEGGDHKRVLNDDGRTAVRWLADALQKRDGCVRVSLCVFAHV